MNNYDGIVTINSLTTEGGYILFQNIDDLDLMIAGAISSGTVGVTNGGIIAITSGGPVTVNALVDSRAGTGGNLIVGDDVTLNVAPQVGAGHVLIAGSWEGDLTLTLPPSQASEVIPRSVTDQIPAERAVSIAERFQAADRNNDGFLIYQEFLGLIGVPSTSDAQRLFRLIDLNSDGMLTLAEIESYLRRRRGRSVSASLPEGVDAVQVASAARY